MTLPKILLVGDPETHPPSLSERLRDWGAECLFASSCADVTAMLHSQRFDLVLGRMRLPDGNAFDLIPLLKGRFISLYAYLPAKDGFWWLPLVRSGAVCSAGPALLEAEFLRLLEEFVKNPASPPSSGADGASHQ